VYLLCGTFHVYRPFLVSPSLVYTRIKDHSYKELKITTETWIFLAFLRFILTKVSVYRYCSYFLILTAQFYLGRRSLQNTDKF
jgi:hypothetical protein